MKLRLATLLFAPTLLAGLVAANAQCKLNQPDGECAAAPIAQKAAPQIAQAPDNAPVLLARLDPAPSPYASFGYQAGGQRVSVRSFHLISSMGSKCLGIEGGNRNPGARAILWNCLEQPDQLFVFTDNHEIRTFDGSNLCLESKGGGMRQMDQIDSWPCNGGANQKWRFSNGQLMSMNQMCVDLRGGDSRFYFGNQDAILYPCNGQNNQHFVAGVTVPRGSAYNSMNPGVKTPIAPHLSDPNIFISHNGSAIVASGGGNIVASGGGNIVASGGGNIVASGGGNIVASGGGNVIVPVASGAN